MPLPNTNLKSLASPPSNVSPSIVPTKSTVTRSPSFDLRFTSLNSISCSCKPLKVLSSSSLVMSTSIWSIANLEKSANLISGNTSNATVYVKSVSPSESTLVNDGRAAGVTFASANASTNVSLTISLTASDFALSPKRFLTIETGTLPFLKPSTLT